MPSSSSELLNGGKKLVGRVSGFTSISVPARAIASSTGARPMSEAPRLRQAVRPESLRIRAASSGFIAGGGITSSCSEPADFRKGLESVNRSMAFAPLSSIA